MANDYDVGTAILGILDSYMDTKAKERIAYAKLNKPEIREVDGQLVAVNPNTLETTYLTGGSNHWGDRTEKLMAENFMTYNSDNEILSGLGKFSDIENYLASNPITTKSDFNSFKPMVKDLNDVQSYNVIAQYNNLIAISDVGPKDYKSVFYDMFGGVAMDNSGSQEKYLPETWSKDASGLETVDPQEENPEYNPNWGKATGTYGMLADVIKTGNLDEQKAFITNVKGHIRSTKTKRLQADIKERRAQKRALGDAFKEYTTAQDKVKGHEGNIFSIIDVDAEDNQIKRDAIKAVKLEADYQRIKYPGRTVIDPINYIDMQTNQVNDRAIQFQSSSSRIIKQLSEVRNPRTGEVSMDAQGKPELTKWWKDFINDKTNFKTIKGMSAPVYSVGGLSKIINKFTQWRREQGDTAVQLEETIPLVHYQLWTDLGDKVFNGLHTNQMNDYDVDIETMRDIIGSQGW